MSVHPIPAGALRRWVWASRAVVSPAERAVLLALADYADEDGTGARPSIETLSDRLGMWPSAVRRRLDALVRSGHLRRRVVSRRAPTVYDLLLDCPVWPERAPEVLSERAPEVESPEVLAPDVPSERAPEVATQRAPEIRERAPEVVTQRAPEVTRSSPITSPEPVHDPGLHTRAHASAPAREATPDRPTEESMMDGFVLTTPPNDDMPEAPDGDQGVDGPAVAGRTIGLADVVEAYAAVAHPSVKRQLRGPGRALALLSVAVERYGAARVIEAIGQAADARADGQPPWEWVIDRLEGRAKGSPPAKRSTEDLYGRYGQSRPAPLPDLPDGTF